MSGAASGQAKGAAGASDEGLGEESPSSQGMKRGVPGRRLARESTVTGASATSAAAAVPLPESRPASAHPGGRPSAVTDYNAPSLSRRVRVEMRDTAVSNLNKIARNELRAAELAQENGVRVGARGVVLLTAPARSLIDDLVFFGRAGVWPRQDAHARSKSEGGDADGDGDVDDEGSASGSSWGTSTTLRHHEYRRNAGLDSLGAAATAAWDRSHPATSHEKMTTKALVACVASLLSPEGRGSGAAVVNLIRGADKSSVSRARNLAATVLPFDIPVKKAVKRERLKDGVFPFSLLKLDVEAFFFENTVESAHTTTAVWTWEADAVGRGKWKKTMEPVFHRVRSPPTMGESRKGSC